MSIFEDVKKKAYGMPGVEPQEISRTWAGKLTMVKWFEDLYTVANALGDLMGITNFVVMVDDKNHHSTVLLPIAHPSRDHRMNLPFSVLGPKDFTEDAFIQLSK